ncbi:unnamed protein product, partial [Iphiclides podalirius]
MTEHWSWLTGAGASEYTYSPPTRPSRPPHRPLVKVATSAHLHTIARCFNMLHGDSVIDDIIPKEIKM